MRQCCNVMLDKLIMCIGACTVRQPCGTWPPNPAETQAKTKVNRLLHLQIHPGTVERKIDRYTDKQLER